MGEEAKTEKAEKALTKGDAKSKKKGYKKTSVKEAYFNMGKGFIGISILALPGGFRYVE